jgi:hypothetical protein
MSTNTRSLLPLAEARLPLYAGVDLGGTNIKAALVDEGGGGRSEVADKPLDCPGHGSDAIFGSDGKEFRFVDRECPGSGYLHHLDGRRNDPRLKPSLTDNAGRSTSHGSS